MSGRAERVEGTHGVGEAGEVVEALGSLKGLDEGEHGQVEGLWDEVRPWELSALRNHVAVPEQWR